MVLPRFAGSLLLGCGAALGLFFLMQRLVIPDAAVSLQERRNPVLEFVRLDAEPPAPQPQRQMRPKPPAESEPEPLTAPASGAQAAEPVPEIPVVAHLPPLRQSGRFATGPALPPVLERKGADPTAPMNLDRELTPLVRINPMYPPHLRRIGIEGHVKARIRVDKEGSVAGIDIVESEPQGRFDRTVLHALRQWKFQPKTVDGVRMAYSGVVTIEFKLVK